MSKKGLLCLLLAAIVAVLLPPMSVLAAPPTVTTNDASDVTTSSARFNGDLTSLGTAGWATVSFVWSTSSGSYHNETTSQVKTSIGAFSADLSGLAPGTTYYYRARVSGHGPNYGEEKSFTTTTSTVPPTVTTEAATGVTTTSATLNGNTTSLGTADNVTVSFVWGTASGVLVNETDGQLMTETGTFQFNLDNLASGTTYYYKAKAVGDGSSYGDEKSFTTEEEGTVTFTDPNLEAAIRAAISKPTGGIYQSDLNGLTTLDGIGLGIADLIGLEHCTSLTDLRLYENQVSDLSPLAGLTGLTVLDLSNNQVSDISPLANLTSLTALYLYWNQISDLSPLTGLTNLTDLRLAGNQISDLSPLTGLTNLTDLRLYDNQISDISPLAGLTSLTVLYLGYNQISDISPLAGLSNLTALHLLVNQISDLSPLANLTSLTDLSLRDNQTGDISPLVDNPGIGSGDTLDLRTNPLSSTSVHTYIPALEGRGVTVYSDAHADQPPNQPINTSPTGSGISLTPTLESSAFSDPDAGDTHAASWWQVTTTAGDYSSPVFDSNTDASHLTSSNVPSLAYSTTYYWRLRHQDIHGLWSSYSNETSFTTVDSPTTPPTAYNDDATGLGTTTATLNGNLSSLGTASSVTVSFVWGTSSGSLTNETTGQAMTSTGAFYFDLASLTLGTTYYCKAKAVGDGTSYGAETSFATITAPPALMTNDASSIATNSGKLNGDLTSLGTASGVTVSFVWGTSSGSYPNESTGQAMTSTGTFYFDLASLTLGTTYYYKAKAVGHGDPIYGVEKSFATGRSPEVETLDPVEGKRKQHLTVTITGADFDGATIVDFGSGITVEDFSVVSSSEITADITVDADAAKGTRDVSVTTAWGTATKTDGFSVVGGGGGVCSGGALVTPGAPSEMTTTLVALGLLLGLGYLFARRGARNSRPGLTAGIIRRGGR